MIYEVKQLSNPDISINQNKLCIQYTFYDNLHKGHVCKNKIKKQFFFKFGTFSDLIDH